MKTLVIVRHSKAVEFAADHTDFNRCLAEKGIQKAKLISSRLAEEMSHVDLMLSSPACRALETAKIYANALSYPEEKIITQDPLYHFGGIDRALQIISEVSDSVGSLMLFGHNPTFNALTWHLCEDFREALPTCGTVGLRFKDIAWSQIQGASGELTTFLTKHRLG